MIVNSKTAESFCYLSAEWMDAAFEYLYIIIYIYFLPISELLEKCREIRNEIIQEEEQYQVNDDITTDSGKGRTHHLTQK